MASLYPRTTKGVLFTFLTFLYIGVILSLLVFQLNLNNRQSQNTIEVAVLNTINAKYDDITDDIITLDHSVGIPSIQQRILPFNYQLDTNSLSVSQTLPLASGKLSLYYDLINAYSIFARDQNAQRTFDGVVVDLNVPKTPVWGGSTFPSAHFNVLPQCIQYAITDENTIHFESENRIGCANPFSLLSSIERVDVNITLPTTVDDYNSASCLFDGNTSCPHADYNANNGPYIRVLFLDANCSQCTLSTSDKNISTHFDGDNWNTITYACATPPCASSPLTLSIGEGLRFSHGGTPLVIQLKIIFTKGISTFYYQDANYDVKKPGFSTYKSNVVVFPK